MRPMSLFCHLQRQLVRCFHVFWKLLPFAVVIGGAPILEGGKSEVLDSAEVQ